MCTLLSTSWIALPCPHSIICYPSFTCAHLWHLSQLPATAGWPPALWLIWIPWSNLVPLVCGSTHWTDISLFFLMKGVEFSGKSLKCEVRQIWVEFWFLHSFNIWVCNCLIILDFFSSYIRKEHSFWPLSLFRDYEKMCSKYIAQFLPGRVLLINIFQYVVPRTPALESLKMQILGALLIQIYRDHHKTLHFKQVCQVSLRHSEFKHPWAMYSFSSLLFYLSLSFFSLFLSPPPLLY